jgi:hypothetical protein
VARDSIDRSGNCFLRGWRVAVGFLGSIRAHGAEPAFHLAGQLGDAYLGYAAVRHRRHIDEQFLGGVPYIW